MSTKNKNIKIKREIDGKTSLYSCYINGSFKKFKAIDGEKLSHLLESLT